MSVNVLVSSFHPFPTISLQLSRDASVSSICDTIVDRYPSFPSSYDLNLSMSSGVLLDLASPLSNYEADFLSVRIIPKLKGGKGGFGSQLRAAGGRMSSQKTSNNDSCRDLSGRRLSTVKEAKKLATYLEAEPQRKKAATEARKAKIEALERQLGIGSSSEKESGESGTKRRFDDTEFLEQSKEIADSVKSAVAAGLLKRKKLKINDPITELGSVPQKSKAEITQSSSPRLATTTQA